jgi:hypothetical protein
MPLSFSDSQIEILQRLAEPLQPVDRDRYLRRVVELLGGQEIGDGTVSRAARMAQRELLRAPISGTFP